MPILQRYARKKRIELILPYLSKDDEILDIGCGDCFLEKSLGKAGFCHIIGIDKNANPSIDARNMPFEDESFDKIIALEVLEHVDCLNEVKRVLKPYGTLIITIPNPDKEWLLNILIFLKLAGSKITPHINKIRCKDIPLRMIVHKNLFLNMSEFGVFE